MSELALLKYALRFFGLTVALAGAGAYVTGRAVARGWRSPWQLVPAALGLALATRFIDYALFGEPLTAARLATDFAILLGACILGHQRTRARQMREQYPWLTST